ncbi:PTS sugar transporter subunit IIA [Listeria ivanovii]|uniref:PTS sugar transporter subunit IIA n=1 Tax=Listeria ivanovii TaxID=1638 RepID=UPI00190749A6|nr:PTS sugar transporter subunit IIA [Listeria ivanovii]MBK2002498.1 PTS sugar transporter subunit IIA [Listeria ivanovii subsp. londoniensis]MBM5607460.1 PTS sugar transporter subunit IIA [Listeria ivanovii]MBM5635791.1 PTS sugar transporter subunit IIA [Listeria ivanovii]MBM5707525.1 PTS sugar transporter subunit IIA [Listeria ivanovii]MBM5719989.1 PTS sugar transporter subunit IIA [Listeria ivanovii]
MSMEIDFLSISNLEVKTKEEAILTLVDALEQADYLEDKVRFEKDILEREGKLSTYIGHEIGLPHAQSRGVNHPCVVIGKLSDPVRWTTDDEFVQIVFLIAVPEDNAGNLHLKVLSKLARWLMHEDFRMKLRVLDDAATVALLNKSVTEGN